MDDPGLAGTYVMIFRIAERVAISLVVVLLAIVVSAAFWRSLQRIDFQLSRDKLSGGGTVVLATPLFALLALIGFSWVSFSNPISVSIHGSAPASAPAVPGTPAPAPVASAAPVDFVGSAGAGAGRVDAAAFARIEAIERLRSLNCIAGAAGELSARDRAALTELRLGLMRAAWTPEWGDFPAFRAWALGETAAAPQPDAGRAFGGTHDPC